MRLVTTIATVLVLVNITQAQTLNNRLYADTSTSGIITRVNIVDTQSLSYRIKHSIVDRNGVDIDVWNGNNVWTICNYKKVDSGYQCIFHSDNELYIFQDRKLIKRYYSNCKSHYK